MNFQPSFRVHLADPLGFTDTPFIITTVYTSVLGYPEGEWFLVIPSGKGLLFAQRTKLDYKTFPEGPVSFDEEFLLNELLDQAKLRLRKYSFETKGDDALSLLSKRLDVLPSNQNLLVNLWMRATYSECLSDIQTKTECVPLAIFLGWVRRLPTLSSNDLYSRNYNEN